MSEEPFKLTDEMIKEIETKVNSVMEAVHGGMKERLVEAGLYTKLAYVIACEVSISIENGEVLITVPTPQYEDNGECDNDSEDPDLLE